MNNIISRFESGAPIYPIEAKYLERIGYGSFFTWIVLHYAKHHEYIEKEERDKDNKRQRMLRAYERAHKWLMYSVKNNHFKLEDKPLIAVKPIIEGMSGRPFCPKDVLRCKGIYFLYRNNELLYIGSSKNIYSRIKSHYWGKKIPFNCFKFLLMQDEYTMFDVVDYEYFYINDFLPPYNRKFKR